MLLIEDRADVGPYTLLGKATTFYPLYETPEVAVVLTLDDDGAPGVVYGIGEDLALQLAAPDLLSYLERFADALEASLQALAQRGDEPDTKGDARAEAAQELMDQHLFAAIVGAGEDEDEYRGGCRAGHGRRPPAGRLRLRDRRPARRRSPGRRSARSPGGRPRRPDRRRRARGPAGPAHRLA